MNDPSGCTYRDGDKLEHGTAGVGPDDQQALLSLVLVLHETHCVAPRVVDVGVRDAVLSGAGSDFRWSTLR